MASIHSAFRRLASCPEQLLPRGIGREVFGIVVTGGGHDGPRRRTAERLSEIPSTDNAQL